MGDVKITVLEWTTKRPQETYSHTILSFEEIKSLSKVGFLCAHLFRYQKARFLTYRLNFISRPFLTALFLRLLGRKICYFEDELGNRKLITIKTLIKLFCKMCRDFLRKGRLIKKVLSEIDSLFKEYSFKEDKKKTLDLSKAPVYLRTDLYFGIRSGGSVAHISGVVNNLDKFTQKPLFLSSDLIPMVRQDLEIHIIYPQNMYWDFPELPNLFFNEVFLKRACEILQEKKPSFIYQRYSLNNYCGAVLAKIYDVPFVLEYNGSAIWVARHWNKPLKYQSLSEKIEILNLKSADLIVVVSKALREELIKRGIEEEKILINPNGVDTELFNPEIDGSAIRKKYNLEKKIVVGFMGTFGPWHGAEILAQAIKPAVKKNPSLHFLFIGEGVKMPLVKEIIRKNGLKDCVTFVGLIPQEKAPYYLAACDILVSPHVPNPDGSEFFGSPTKLFEYMAMEKAIVASRLGQIKEILTHQRNAILVTPQNTKELGEEILKLSQDKTLRKRLGMNARQNVLLSYTWKKNVERTIEKLKSLCLLK